jgi:VWFA-related protein
MGLAPVLLMAQEPVVLRVPAALVVAPTSVTDHSGNFVDGLTAADFQLFDNGIPQKIYEDDDFLPISLGIAIEGDLKKQVIERVHDLGPLLGALVVGVGGEAAIFRFNGKLEVVQNFTPDLARLTRALRHLEYSPGPSHVIDATLDVVRLLDQRARVRRRILLLVSESRDAGSHKSLDDAFHNVPMSNTLIYWLNVGRGAEPQDPVPALTRYSGGREYAISNERAIERAITQIGEEIHGQYLLTYAPANTSGLGFHRIQVTTKHVRMEVRSRPGYWAPELKQ